MKVYNISYLNKDGKGFSKTEPWLLYENPTDSISKAKEDSKDLINQGFKNVQILETTTITKIID